MRRDMSERSGETYETFFDQCNTYLLDLNFDKVRCYVLLFVPNQKSRVFTYSEARLIPTTCLKHSVIYKNTE